MIKVITSFLYNNIVFNKRTSIYDALKKRNINAEKVNNDYQIKKLASVLDTAFYNIPFYKKNGKIDLENLTYEEFQKIPIMSKDIIRTCSDDLINRNYDKKEEVEKNSSGGSTGEPVQFYQTKDQASHGMANYYYALHLNGVKVFNSSVNLWGAERDMHNASEKFDIRSYLHNVIKLNTFVLSPQIIKNYIARLNKIKPEFIKAYVHSIYDMSKFINKTEHKINFKPIIQSTTGPLYPNMKAEIKRAFNEAHVFNFYGSREVSAIATEVIDKEGLYVLYDNVFVEILDKNDHPVKKGEKGEIVITTLNNYYMPLIRYRIGDRAVKGDLSEFGTMRIENVLGRTLGVIHKNDGSKIDGQFFTVLFFDKKGIQSFQLVQKTLFDIHLKIVKTDLYTDKELDIILSRIYEELPGVEVKVTFEQKIELTSTGKIMYVYSELEN